MVLIRAALSPCHPNLTRSCVRQHPGHLSLGLFWFLLRELLTKEVPGDERTCTINRSTWPPTNPASLLTSARFQLPPLLPFICHSCSIWLISAIYVQSNLPFSFLDTLQNVTKAPVCGAFLLWLTNPGLYPGAGTKFCSIKSRLKLRLSWDPPLPVTCPQSHPTFSATCAHTIHY